MGGSWQRPRHARRAVLQASVLSFGLVLLGVTGDSPASTTSAQAAPAAPPCSTAVAPGPVLSGVHLHFVSGLQSPFGVAVSPNSRHVFVATANTLIEYSLRSGVLTDETAGPTASQELLGLAISHSGQTLVAAEGSGAEVFDARVAALGGPPTQWQLATLESAGGGAIEADLSPDDTYAFVSLEDSQEVAVFRLTANGSGSKALVGYIPVGFAPVGLAIAPDGRYLYVTSEEAHPALGQAGQGSLTTIDLREAEVSPSRSVISTVLAGCSPVRVVATTSSVFVTARESDRVLEFSAAALVTAPSVALRSEVQVGEAPVGLALFHHAGSLAVADSNRFESPGASANLAIVTIGPAGQLRLRGYVRAGLFPRDMVVSPDGRTLVVADNQSGQVETIQTAELR